MLVFISRIALVPAIGPGLIVLSVDLGEELTNIDILLSKFMTQNILLITKNYPPQI